MTTLLASAPMVIATSIGARTGKPRTHALLRVDDPQDNDRFAVLATNYAQSRLPGWFYNLKKHPQANCVIDGKAAPYITHEACDEEWEHFWGAAVDAFAGFESYAERLENVRSIPIIVCERE
jgi:deazaflavin-dependent oxidoreductase (nitroreductase family)